MNPVLHSSKDENWRTPDAAANIVELEASEVGIIETLSEEVFEIDTLREDRLVRLRLRAYLFVKEAQDEPVMIPCDRWSWIRYGLSFYGPAWVQWIFDRVLPPARVKWIKAQASFPDTMRKGFTAVERHTGPVVFHWVDAGVGLYPPEEDGL